MLVMDVQVSIMEWILIKQLNYSELLENWITAQFKNWYIKKLILRTLDIIIHKITINVLFFL